MESISTNTAAAAAATPILPAPAAVPLIYQQIPKIMQEMEAVKKEKRTQEGGRSFAYRGIDDVMNAMWPLLSKYHVFVIPEVLEHNREERTTTKGTTLLYSILRIRYSFVAEDGSSIQAITIGEGMDSGDKASNKAMAVAFKYALFQVFCIPTEDMAASDPDGQVHSVQPQRQATQRQAGSSGQKRQQAANPTPAEQRGRNEANRGQQGQQPGAIPQSYVASLISLAQRKGVSMTSLLNSYGVPDPSAMTDQQWQDAMNRLSQYPDKQQNTTEGR